jgi:hypothetical protein
MLRGTVISWIAVVAAAFSIPAHAQLGPLLVNPTSYQCYRVKVQSLQQNQQLPYVTDQFRKIEAVNIDLSQPVYLCAPATIYELNGVTPARDERTHYLCYYEHTLPPLNRNSPKSS